MFVSCCRCSTISTPDKLTEELAVLVREEVYQISGHYPHLLLCRLSRLKVDVNREMDEGTFGVTVAVRTWQDYHYTLRKVISHLHGPALLLDLHGHGHPQQRVELGYLIHGININSGNIDVNIASIKALSRRTHINVKELLHGVHSFGGLLEAEGFSAIPSPTYPCPHRTSYHHGGFITRTYGSSHNDGMMDAIQVESPRDFREPIKLPIYARALARAACKFMKLYYHMNVTKTQDIIHSRDIS